MNEIKSKVKGSRNSSRSSRTSKVVKARKDVFQNDTDENPILFSGTLKEFHQANNFNKIVGSRIRYNTNHYPFLLFLREDPEEGQDDTECIYFSKQEAQNIEDSDRETIDIEYLRSLNVVQYVTEDGEERTKLTSRGSRLHDLDAL